MEGSNHPFVVWGTCFLWLTSVFSIFWSLALFFCVSEMLLVTGTDIVIALILLSGVIMFPTNVYMLYTIGNGQKISHKSRVLCCPLWMLLTWIIVINLLGIFLCIQRICMVNTMDFIVHSMRHYRHVSRYKHFIDNLQWSLKCCGLHSYKDWFNYDWFEKIRDYEWNPNLQKLSIESKKDAKTVSDSVPLSCCKSGTCVPNYLLELGTQSIHTKGCSKYMYRIYMISMNVHIFVFFAIVITEIIILTCIIAGSKDSNNCKGSKKKQYNVKHLMAVNNRFLPSSCSTSESPEDDCAEESEFELKGMVFLSVVNWARNRGPDEFWRKRRVFRLAAHYIGRRRNCYSIAVRNVHRALVYATKARQLKKQDMKELWNTRITAACEQHNMTHFSLKEGLERANIMLDRKSLSDLACWEPHTFESLAAIAKQKLEVDGFTDGADKKHPTGMSLNLKDVMLEHWLKTNKN